MMQNNQEQECIPVGCVPPARNRTAVGGLPDRDPPGQRPPWMETPLDRDPPGWRPPSTETPPPCELSHRQV